MSVTKLVPCDFVWASKRMPGMAGIEVLLQCMLPEEHSGEHVHVSGDLIYSVRVEPDPRQGVLPFDESGGESG